MGRIIFRLRPGKDDDIKRALENELKKPEADKSVIMREALRAYFFGKRPAAEVKQLEPESLDDLDLEQKEKADEEIDADLDTLLGDF